MRLVKMLQSHGVTPLVVFDGGKLPSKVGEEAARERCAPVGHPCPCHVDGRAFCDVDGVCEES